MYRRQNKTKQYYLANTNYNVGKKCLSQRSQYHQNTMLTRLAAHLYLSKILNLNKRSQFRAKRYPTIVEYMF